MFGSEEQTMFSLCQPSHTQKLENPSYRRSTRTNACCLLFFFFRGPLVIDAFMHKLGFRVRLLLKASYMTKGVTLLQG